MKGGGLLPGMAYIFITKEKTNWKYLLIIFILGVIVGASTIWYSSQQALYYQQTQIELPSQGR